MVSAHEDSFSHRGKGKLGNSPLYKSSKVCYNGHSGYCFVSHPQVTLAVLLVYSIASLAVNAFLFLYKERHKVFAIYALVPSIAAVYPLCVAAWVTKQYSW